MSLRPKPDEQRATHERDIYALAGAAIETGLREYEKGLPHIDDISPEKLGELKEAIQQGYNANKKIIGIIAPNEKPAVVAAQEILDTIELYFNGNSPDYIADAVFQTEAKKLKPLFDLLGIK